MWYWNERYPIRPSILKACALALILACLGALAMADTAQAASSAGDSSSEPQRASEGPVVRKDDALKSYSATSEEMAGNPWLSKEYQGCGGSCLYSKANEGISVQAIYTIQRINQIDAAGNDAKQIKDAVGEFCDALYEGRVNGSLSDSQIQDCGVKYRRMLVTQLYQLRADIDQNKDNKARLEGYGAVDSRAPSAGAFAPEEDGKGVILQNSYVATLDDLKNVQTTSESKGERRTRYQQWVQEMSQHAALEPLREEFYVTREIPRDPSLPNGDKIIVIERDAKTGQKRLDEKAYLAAMQRYQKKAKDAHLTQDDLKSLTKYQIKVRGTSKAQDSEVAAFRAARKGVVRQLDKTQAKVQAGPNAKDPTQGVGLKGYAQGKNQNAGKPSAATLAAVRNAASVRQPASPGMQKDDYEQVKEWDSKATTGKSGFFSADSQDLLKHIGDNLE